MMLDIAPEGESFSETEKKQKIIIDEVSKKLETSKVKLLWGTANLLVIVDTWQVPPQILILIYFNMLLLK